MCFKRFIFKSHKVNIIHVTNTVMLRLTRLIHEQLFKKKTHL